MVGLVDIAPASETVEVRGERVEVVGVSAAGIAGLLARFPELRRAVSGGEIELDRIIALGGEIVGAIIAAGCGAPGDEQAEAVATRLPLEAQADLLEAILRATMPKGVGPFVEKLRRMGVLINLKPLGGDAQSTTGPATT